MSEHTEHKPGGSRHVHCAITTVSRECVSRRGRTTATTMTRNGGSVLSRLSNRKCIVEGREGILYEWPEAVSHTAHDTHQALQAASIYTARSPDSMTNSSLHATEHEAKNGPSIFLITHCGGYVSFWISRQRLYALYAFAFSEWINLSSYGSSRERN